MNPYWCAKCGGVLDPATLQSITGYLCTCPKEQTSASNNSIPMTPETPSLTPRTEALQFYASWGSSGDGGHVIHAEDAEELETRALSAEADNVRLKQEIERLKKTIES